MISFKVDINLPMPTLGQLLEDEVHIWQVDLPTLQAHSSQLLPLLSPQERESYERACQFQTHPPQLASRALLRMLLARYVNGDPRTLDISYGAHGKPTLTQYPWLQFSISHTKSEVIFALTRHHRLGIDLETERDLSDSLDLAERFFSPDEYTYLSTLTEHDRRVAFFRLWTVKEAFVKAVGFGLSYPLSDFTVSTTDRQTVIVDKATTKEPSKAKDWHCHAWELNDNKHMALVVEGQHKQLYFGANLDAMLLCTN